jgi:hypothetical protein
MENTDVQYSVKLLGAIQSCFSEDSENYIDRNELLEGNNLTHFMQALANTMPNHVYNTLTGEQVNNLEFNHIANKLVFQYATKD